jgi:hypothetical protein
LHAQNGAVAKLDGSLNAKCRCATRERDHQAAGHAKAADSVN